jgi:iron complex outermembrane receptor protein
MSSFLIVVPLLLSAQQSQRDTIRSYLAKEFVVTATRTSGDVLNIPLALTIVSLKDLSSQRKIGVNEALSLVPGVFAQSRSGGQDVRLTIRGFGARASGDRSNAATIRGIKVLVDGIPETEPDGRTPLDLIDLNATERIEIVRSNASTLFGNASGGVISFQTGSAEDGPFVESNNTFGDFGFRKNNISAASTRGTSRVFVSASNSNFTGWRQNSQSQTTQLNAVLDSRLNETTDLRVLASGVTNTFYIPGALTQQQFDSDPTQANATYLSRKERRFNRTGRLAFDLFTTFSENQSIDALAYITPKVQARSERGQYRDFNRYHLGGGLVYSWKGEQESLLKKVMAGVDESYQDGTILFYDLLNGERGDSLRTNKREGAETFGFFVQSEVRLSDKLLLTVGARFDAQRYIAEDYAAGAKKTNIPEEMTFSHVTPKLGALYRLSQNHSLYASVGGGLEAPAFNEIDPPPTIPNVKLNPLLAPMVSTTYEVGAKGIEDLGGDQFVRSLSYSAAAYRIGVTNEITPYNGGAYFFSAGRSTRLGFELSGQAGLSGGLSVSTAFTYLDAKYDSYVNDLGDFSGRSVPGIPKTVLNMQIRYSSSIGATVEVGVASVADYFADDANTLTVSASTVLTANAGYSFRVGPLANSVFAGVNNLANLKYAASAFINPVGGSYLEPGLPRNFFGGLNMKLEL